MLNLWQWLFVDPEDELSPRSLGLGLVPSLVPASFASSAPSWLHQCLPDTPPALLLHRTSILGNNTIVLVIKYQHYVNPDNPHAKVTSMTFTILVMTNE